MTESSAHSTDAEVHVSASVQTVQSGWWLAFRHRVMRQEIGPWSVVFGMALIWVFFQNLNQNFLTPRNLSNLILQIAVLGIIAIGVVLVLLIGEIDLSIGAVAGVSAGVIALILAYRGWNVWVAILATLLFGATIGTVQGLWIVKAGVPSFIVTLAGLMAWQGVQLALLGDLGELRIQDATLKGIPLSYLTATQSWVLAVLGVLFYGLGLWWSRSSRLRIGLEAPSVQTLCLKVLVTGILVLGLVELLNRYFGVPYLLVVLLVLLGLFTFLVEKTTYGQHIYAVGGNAEAARRAGIDVGRIRVSVFAMTSMLAALGGIVSASREFAASVSTGGGTLLLDAMAAAVIGGASLFGGRGRIYNALLGALVIGSVANGLNLLGQPASTKSIATGLILLVAVSIDAIGRKKRRSAGQET